MPNQAGKFAGQNVGSAKTKLHYIWQMALSYRHAARQNIWQDFSSQTFFHENFILLNGLLLHNSLHIKGTVSRFQISSAQSVTEETWCQSCITF